MDTGFGGRQPAPWTHDLSRRLGRLGPVARALLTFVALGDGLLSLELWTLRNHETRWAAESVLAVVAPVRLLAALALASAALYLATRPKRAFQRILLALAAGAGLLSLKAGQPGLIAAAMIDGLAALLAGWLWPEEGDPLSSRLGWSLLGIAAAATTLSAWLLFTQHRGPHAAPTFTLPLLAGLTAAAAGLALLDRNPPLPATRDLAAALPLYLARGMASVSPFALMHDKCHVWASDAGSFLAVGCRTGVALALGPAIGEPGSAARLHREFRATCRTRGWRPAFYQVPDETVAELPGSRRLTIGSEAVVELDRFGLGGRAMANLRHQVTKARRLGVTARVLPEAQVAWDVVSMMARLSDEVTSRRRLGEMAFSVGRRGEPAEVERTVGLAFRDDRHLVAYVTWLWLPAAATMVLDEVKRGRDAPPGTTELLIATSLQALRGRARRASLGLAPITPAGQAPRLAVVESFLHRALGISSMSPGLYAFKAKFRPTWEPRHLVVERLTDLPAVLLATFLLHYPDMLHRSLGRVSHRPLPQ